MKNPILNINMYSGKVIKIELFPECCPNTVRSVISLANKGAYDNNDWHRVLKGFVVQTDCDIRRGFSNGCDYALPGEYADNGYTKEMPLHKKGFVGMGNLGGGLSFGSAFNIMLGDFPHLDGKHSVIGYVTEGMDEVERIGNVDLIPLECSGRAFNTPVRPEVIVSMRVETFGTEYSPPVTVPYPEDYVKILKERGALLESVRGS